MHFLCFIVPIGVFLGAVNMFSTPEGIGLGDIHAANLTRQHSINARRGVGGRAVGRGWTAKCALEIADQEP